MADPATLNWVASGTRDWLLVGALSHARRKFYTQSFDHPDSQLVVIRELVYAERNRTRTDIDQLIEDAGDAATGGRVSHSLVVLNEVPEQIEAALEAVSEDSSADAETDVVDHVRTLFR